MGRGCRRTPDKLLPGIDIENLSLLHCCNGFLLFEHSCNIKTFEYVVCNPATEQLVAVPRSPLQKNMDCDWFGNTNFLMFDPVVSLHFHLIQFWNSFQLSVAAVHIFSSETGVWSDRASEWKAGEEGGEWARWGESSDILCVTDGTLFNNMLHFIVCPVNGSNGDDMIVAVDRKGETCRIIPWRENFSYPHFVGQSQGQLFCLTVGVPQKSELSIWVLEEYDTEEWSLKHRVSFLKLFGKVSCRENYDYAVVAIHPNCNLIFFFDRRCRKLISYDMDSEEVHALCTLRVAGTHK
ncbi:hypothetical protein EJB05_14697, partial [Eragrostis curvula]